MSLFHYTDVGAVKSIIKDEKLWFTDFRFLNDSQELHEGFRVLNNILKHPNHGSLNNLPYKEKVLKYVKATLFSDETYRKDLESVFIFSLSNTNNLLSQWRAYGSYSIEFETKLLEERTGTIAPCIYVDEKNDKFKCAEEKIYQVLKIIGDKINNEDDPRLYDELIKIVFELAKFKHNDFYEENEFRIISQAGSQYIGSKMKYCSKKKFRVKGSMLVPYIEVPISIDCIKSIMVGPVQNQELAYTSLLEFVNETIRQNESLNDDYKLKVEKSKTPYRVP